MVGAWGDDPLPQATIAPATTNKLTTDRRETLIRYLAVQVNELCAPPRGSIGNRAHRFVEEHATARLQGLVARGNPPVRLVTTGETRDLAVP